MGRSESIETPQEDRVKRYKNLNVSQSEYKVQNLIPEGATISEMTRDLLQRMLVIDENSRISWEELFNHKAVRVDSEQIQSSSQLLETNLSDVEDMTLNNFLLSSTLSSLSDRQQEEIQEYGRRLTMHYQVLQTSLVRARRARDYLEFERQCGFFFIQVAKELESQKKINPEIPEDLYIKCMFLLYKRIYAIFLNLNQMLTFDTHQSGIIEIDKDDWIDMIKSEQLKSDISKLRATTSRDYDFSRKEFAKWKDMLYDAQYSLSQFSLIDRGQAFKDNSIQEDEDLILAINDNFLQLFLMLAKELEQVYTLCLETQKPQSKQQIFVEKKVNIFKIIQFFTQIDFIFVYDLIILLCFRNVVKVPTPESNQPLINFHKYYEDRKRIEDIEILHRIHKQYTVWKLL